MAQSIRHRHFVLFGAEDLRKLFGHSAALTLNASHVPEIVPPKWLHLRPLKWLFILWCCSQQWVRTFVPQPCRNIIGVGFPDHFNREGKSRVVGILLGENFRGKVDCTNCFAVPFEESDDHSTWFLDQNYITAMRGMFRKVTASEVIVGWYSTGPTIIADDLAIHQVLRRFCPEPVFVIIDVKPKKEDFPTQAYIAKMQDNQDGTELVETFQHIPSSMGALEAEEIGVEHLLRDVQDTTATSLHARIAQKATSLRAMRANLVEIRSYLEDVVSKRLPINQHILAELQEIVNLLPNLNVPELRQAIAVASNDSTAALAVAHYMRAVLALHTLIDNKLELAHKQQQLAEALAAKQQKEKEDKEKAEKEKADKEKADKDKPADAAQAAEKKEKK